LFLNDRRIG